MVVMVAGSQKRGCVRMVVVKYKKVKEGMFFSHLNMLRLWNKLIAISSIEVKYSEGFNKTRRLYFSSPTRVGVESECEYIVIDTNESAREVKTKLENNMPKWLEIVYVLTTEGKFNVASMNKGAEYLVSFDEYKSSKPKIKEFFDSKEIVIPVILHGEEKMIDVKDRIIEFSCYDDNLKIVAGVGDKSVRIDELVKKLLAFLNKPNNDYEIMKTKLFTRDEEGELVDVDKVAEDMKYDD